MSTRLLSPPVAIGITWALTAKFSTDEPSRPIAALAEKTLEDVLEKTKGSKTEITKSETTKGEETKSTAAKLADTETSGESSTPSSQTKQSVKTKGDDRSEGSRTEATKSWTAKSDTALFEATPEEMDYVRRVVPEMEASLRSVDVVYKGRELNFQENQKLRESSVEELKDLQAFGAKGADLLRAVLVVSSTTATPLLSAQIFGVTDPLRLAVLTLAGLLGGLSLEIFAVMWRYRKQARNYVRQDYERNLYYDHYVLRVKEILLDLYWKEDQIHEQVFKARWSKDPDEGRREVEQLVRGFESKRCPYVVKHMIEKKINMSIWPVCETGEPVATHCEFWEGQKTPPILNVRRL